MGKYALGLDFGTNSCRSLIVDLEDGRELASCVFLYPSGKDGVLVDPKDPNVARQNPRDYLDCFEVIVKESIDQAKDRNSNFDPQAIIGIGGGNPTGAITRVQRKSKCHGMAMERPFQPC